MTGKDGCPGARYPIGKQPWLRMGESERGRAMKKPRNTPQFDDAVEASSSRDATDPVDAATASEIVAEIPIIAAPNVAEASVPAAAQSPRPQLPHETAK